MLTININDLDLEKLIADKARSIGKSMHEIVEDLLTNVLSEKNEQLNCEVLDPKKYGYYISEKEESISENENEDVSSH